MRNGLIIIALFALAAGMTACGFTKKIELTPVETRQITFVADPDTGRPLTIDIIFPFNRETLEDLEGFTASGWFSVKGTDLGNWRDNAVWQTVEVAPGQRLTIRDFPEGYTKGVAAFLFVNYPNPGLHRMIFTGAEQPVVELHARTLSAEEGSPYLLTSPPEPPRPQPRQTRF